MARKPNARVVLNRAKFEGVRLDVGMGMDELARTIVEIADVPDAEPFGVGLVTSGGTFVAIDGKKVAGDSPKPRGARTGKGITAIAGFGFPARFQEFGTIHHRAQPFLTPARDRSAARAGEIVGSVTRPLIGGKG
jgi:hypothetical protein